MSMTSIVVRIIIIIRARIHDQLSGIENIVGRVIITTSIMCPQ